MDAPICSQRRTHRVANGHTQLPTQQNTRASNEASAHDASGLVISDPFRNDMAVDVPAVVALIQSKLEARRAEISWQRAGL